MFTRDSNSSKVQKQNIYILQVEVLKMKIIKTNEIELWEYVKHSNKQYSVSNMGRVKSNYCGKNIRTKILKQGAGNSGYLHASLKLNGVRKTVEVHKLVSNHFPYRSNKTCVNHVDGNKQNNKFDNLEIVTYRENQKHAIDSGLSRITGTDNYQAKLSESDVHFLRALSLTREYTYYELGGIFGIAYQTAHDIAKYKTWKHLE